MRDTIRSGDIGKRPTARESAIRRAPRGRVPLAAVVLTVAATLGLCSGCGSAHTEATSKTASSSGSSSSVAASPAPTSASDADCNVTPPGPSSIDGIFTNVAGFTVTPICPADFLPIFDFAKPQVLGGFGGTICGQLSTGQTVMKVFAGELASGSGDTFVHTFLSTLSDEYAKAVPMKTLATDTQQLGGHPVTYFNVQLDIGGYAYAAGPTVVIALFASEAPYDVTKDGFTRILANLH